jgi:hypothetical protein
MTQILDMLKGGDLRSIGRSEEVVQIVLENPTRFGEVILGMVHEDRIVRMRSADAVEKITFKHPEWLQPYKEFILAKAAIVDQQEVRWHVAQILPRLDLSNDDVQVAVDILKGFLDDDSRIVRTFTLEALVGFIEKDANLEAWVIPLIEKFVEEGSPAMRSRGKRLLSRLRKS